MVAAAGATAEEGIGLKIVQGRNAGATISPAGLDLVGS